MAAKPPWLTVHPLSPEDSLGATALRASVAAFKGKLAGTAARGPFDAVMERVAAPAGVTFVADTVGGISGWWAKPVRPRKGAAIIHVHGGWFNLGTAHAYRNFVGHIASSAGADAFIPEYRLAPEHRFRRRGCHLAGDRPGTYRRELSDSSGSGSVLHQVPGRRARRLVSG